MFSYSGVQIAPGEGVPSLSDVAVHLGRICRFAGACREFWSVLLHSLAVWEYMQNPHFPFKVDSRLQLLALLHDASEAVMGDITKPFKSDDMKKVERDIEHRIYESLGIVAPASHESTIVKFADTQVLYGEARTIGPVGLETHYNSGGTRTEVEQDPIAEGIVLSYYKAFPVLECIVPESLVTHSPPSPM